MSEGIKPEEGVDIKPEENKEALPEVEPEPETYESDIGEVPIQLKWENEFSIEVTFPDSTMGLLIFSPVAGVPCLYSGRLIDDTRSLVTVSGCQDQRASITLASKRLPGGLIDLTLEDGVTTVIRLDTEFHPDDSIALTDLDYPDHSFEITDSQGNHHHGDGSTDTDPMDITDPALPTDLITDPIVDCAVDLCEDLTLSTDEDISSPTDEIEDPTSSAVQIEDLTSSTGEIEDLTSSTDQYEDSSSSTDEDEDLSSSTDEEEDLTSSTDEGYGLMLDTEETEEVEEVEEPKTDAPKEPDNDAMLEASEETHAETTEDHTVDMIEGPTDVILSVISLITEEKASEDPTADSADEATKEIADGTIT